jgi:histidine ammonia-lyase
MKKIQLDGHNLNAQKIYEYSLKDDFEFSIHPKAREKVLESRMYVLDVVDNEVPTYGVNTGFGALSNKHVGKNDLAQLQVNLIRSHCVGVGKPFPTQIVRSMMLILANSLLKGYSGIQIEAIELIIQFINHHITPVVPEKGSVGASGDLAPLSHVAICLIGEGEVLYKNERLPTAEVLKKLKLSPIQLGPKDGLALINGTHLMAALATHAVIEIEALVKTADLACALSLEGVRGSIKAFDEDLHALKAHEGQVASAKNIRDLVNGSDILNSHENCARVQDPYSFRCAPQVHGAVRQTLSHAQTILNQELQSVTDNPIVFAKKKKIVSGGHFHGEALAMILDYLAIGASEICSISERRVVKLLNPEFSHLPAFLAKESGLQSGLMIVQYTSAALVSENKILSHPSSVDSVPTSNEKEDHVSMGPMAGRKLLEIIFNTKQCLSIEFLCNTQAINLLRPLKTSAVLERVITKIQTKVPPITDDRYLAKDIEEIANLISTNELLNSCNIELK